jgi:uncharacterized oligopeptide transporter (OPT) family protein
MSPSQHRLAALKTSSDGVVVWALVESALAVIVGAVVVVGALVVVVGVLVVVVVEALVAAVVGALVAAVVGALVAAVVGALVAVVVGALVVVGTTGASTHSGRRNLVSAGHLHTISGPTYIHPAPMAS